jgi:hypothetical protein
VARRETRFGVMSEDGRRSSYWKVRLAARRGDIYVAQAHTGRFLHVSLHEDTDYWHLFVKTPVGQVRKPFAPPVETIPGLTEVLEMWVPHLAVVPAAPPAKSVRRTTMPPVGQAVRFHLMLDSAPESRAQYPGASTPGARLIDRLTTDTGAL